MLSKVLDKSTCAECRFCCSFRRSSLWETPLFPIETVDKLTKNGCSCGQFDIKQDGDIKFGQMNLYSKYKTNDAQEEAACDYLDSLKGCVLNDEDKPFDCKIWPLRVMKMKDKSLVIALTPTCQAINKQPIEDIKRLVEDELSDTIFEYANKHPFIIKEYREGFPILSFDRK